MRTRSVLASPSSRPNVPVTISTPSDNWYNWALLFPPPANKPQSTAGPFKYLLNCTKAVCVCSANSRDGSSTSANGFRLQILSITILGRYIILPQSYPLVAFTALPVEVSDWGADISPLNPFGWNLKGLAPKLNSTCAFFKQTAGKNDRFVNEGGISYAFGNSVPEQKL